MVLDSQVFFCYSGEVADLQKEVANLRAAQKSNKQQMKKEKSANLILRKRMEEEMKDIKIAVSRCITICKVNMSYPEVLCIAPDFAIFLANNVATFCHFHAINISKLFA